MASVNLSALTQQLPLLLQGELHQYQRRSSSVDYQERFRAEIRATPASVAESAILVITRAADHDVDRLSLELGRAGVPLYRLDTDRCTYLDMVIDLERRELRLDGRLMVPRVVWLRHLDLFSLHGPPPLTPYVQQQYPTILNYLSQFPGAQQVNPAHLYSQFGRLEQLSAAVAAGMEVPSTCVASTVTDACRLLDLPPQDIIAKPPRDHFIEDPPGHVTGVFPRPVTDNDALIEPVPLVYQALLNADAEWRLYWVDGQIISYRLKRGGAAALWTDPDGIAVEAQDEPPAGLEASVSRLCAAMGLRYGAFDFLEVDGAMVFLEVNLDGDWAWFERKAGDERVSQAARTMLIDMLGVSS